MNPSVRSLPLAILQVDPEYQRVLKESDVTEFAANWNPTLAGVLSVSQRTNGTFWVFDGQHRMAAMRRLGITDWPCWVVASTQSAEAHDFVALQTKRRQVGRLDQHRADLVAGNPLSIMVDRVLTDFGLSLGGKLSAVKRVYTIAAVGEDHLREVLATCLAAWPTGHDALADPVLQGMSLFLRLHPIVDRCEITRKLATVAPLRIVNDARASQSSLSTNAGAALANQMIAVYNHRRTSRRLRYINRIGKALLQDTDQ